MRTLLSPTQLTLLVKMKGGWEAFLSGVLFKPLLARTLEN
jgi:hypothetical protein